jgi:hypothetical protein
MRSSFTKSDTGPKKTQKERRLRRASRLSRSKRLRSKEGQPLSEPLRIIS